MRAFLALAALAPLLLPQTAPPSSSKPAPAASSAPAALSTFRSEALHLSYAHPSDWQSADLIIRPMLAQQQAAATGDMKTVLACVKVPYSGLGLENGPNVALIFAADVGCLHLDMSEDALAQFTRGLLGGVDKTIPGTKFSDPQTFLLAGRKASLLHGVLVLPSTKSTLHMAIACTLDKPNVVCWEMMAQTDAQLAIIASNPVTFEGSQPSAVIPAALLTTP